MIASIFDWNAATYEIKCLRKYKCRRSSVWASHDDWQLDLNRYAEDSSLARIFVTLFYGMDWTLWLTFQKLSTSRKSVRVSHHFLLLKFGAPNCENLWLSTLRLTLLLPVEFSHHVLPTLRRDYCSHANSLHISRPQAIRQTNLTAAVYIVPFADDRSSHRRLTRSKLAKSSQRIHSCTNILFDMQPHKL